MNSSRRYRRTLFYPLLIWIAAEENPKMFDRFVVGAYFIFMRAGAKGHRRIKRPYETLISCIYTYVPSCIRPVEVTLGVDITAMMMIRTNRDSYRTDMRKIDTHGGMLHPAIERQ